MSLNYVRPDEEFFGVLKLTNGEEVLARCIVVEESEGHFVVFAQNPAKVHATEVVKETKRAVAVGLKKWMVFSDEDFFIVPEERIVTVAPMSTEAVAMYKIFCASEFDDEEDNDPWNLDEKGIPMNESMGLIGNTRSARKFLEDLFNKDIS